MSKTATVIVLTEAPGEHGWREQEFRSAAKARAFARRYLDNNSRGCCRILSLDEYNKLQAAEAADKRHRAEHPEDYA